MTTNIVEQMLVELMLDTSKFAAQADKAEKKNQALEKSLDKTEKASKQAGKANEELAKKYHSSIEQTAKFGQTIAKVTKELTGFFAVIIGSTGLFKLANDAAHANMEVSKLSGQLGMATASITDWQNAAGAFGGSAQGMTASLTGIKQAMNGLVMFGDASMLPYFNALGVSVVDNAGKVRKLDDVMLDLADSFQKMPKEQAYTIGKKMGFDDGTINALISGRKELQEILDIQKRMYHSDEKAIARSRELTKQQAILSAHWQSMKQLVGDALTPILLTLIKVVNSFFDFLQRHEKVIKAVFQTAAIVIGMLLIPTLLSAGRALLAFIAPFTPLIRLMGALGIAINPVIAAVTALAGAFVLLYDDYDTWAKGGKSLFDWGAFSAGIKDSKMSVDTLRAAFGNLVDAVKNNTIPTLKGYAEILGKLVRGDFTGAAKQAKQMIDNYSDIATGIIADAMGEKKEDVAGFIGESMYRLFHGGKDYFEQNGIQKPVETNVSKTAKRDVQIIGKWSPTKEAFVKKYYGAAAEVSRGLKGAISPEGILAQWAQETGWGQHITPGTGYNLGNHKADKYWKGERTKNRILDKRTGSRDYYRVYSENDLAREHIKFLSTKRYAKVRSAKNDFEAFSAMQQAGYAEDKNYANHIMARAKEIKNHTRIIGISNGAAKAQQMISSNLQNAGKSVVNNDNRKHVNVNIQNINVKTSSNTVSGNTVAAMKETHNYMFNQLGVSMT
ncbi:glucosaminidase domain-containing protein [Snodgrassella alvi]|uniref:glucosaminidase domain-containing protein n=1 Tax=Snodgrassella alvi TaxID=1196083 RepID=UPI00351C08E6